MVHQPSANSSTLEQHRKEQLDLLLVPHDEHNEPLIPACRFIIAVEQLTSDQISQVLVELGSCSQFQHLRHEAEKFPVYLRYAKAYPCVLRCIKLPTALTYVLGHHSTSYYRAVPRTCHSFIFPHQPHAAWRVWG